MKTLIDMSFVSPKTMHNSIPILIFRFLGGVPKTERHKLKLLFDTGCAEQLHKLFPDYEYTTVNVRNIRKLYYDPRLLFAPFSLRTAINNSGCDAVFFPCDGNRFALFKFKIPSIVMINDLKWLKADTKSKQKTLLSLIRSILGRRKSYVTTIERASLITTNSEFTKKDLLQFFPETDSSKVHAIHLSVPPINGTHKPNGITDNDKFILNVNTILQFKNLLTLLKAFVAISTQYNGNLVIVGRKTTYWNEVLIPFINENKLKDRVIRLENLEEEELRYLYEHADVFVTPSLHEGFGFTPVEAGIYGCPVISTMCESLPEVTLGMVNYYEPPTDDTQLSRKLLEVLNNPPSKKELSNISDTFKSKYSVENHARNLLNLFDMIQKKQ